MNIFICNYIGFVLDLREMILLSLYPVQLYQQELSPGNVVCGIKFCKANKLLSVAVPVEKGHLPISRNVQLKKEWKIKSSCMTARGVLPVAQPPRGGGIPLVMSGGILLSSLRGTPCFRGTPSYRPDWSSLWEITREHTPGVTSPCE